MRQEIVFITGCSSGFGLLATLKLANKNFFVIATMRDIHNQSLLMELAREMGIEDNIKVLQLDVTKQEQIADIVSLIKVKYGRIDILINNAGECLGGISELLSLEKWKMQFETNFFSVVSITNAFLPLMREQKKGKIINIGSISGIIGLPGLGAYAASKFALEGYSESLRYELLPFNIYVSIVEAGSFNTNIWSKSFNTIDGSLVTSEYDSFIKKIFEHAKEAAQQSEDPSLVISLITSICSKNKPRLRYPIGKGVRFVSVIKNIIPSFIIERVIRKKLKI
ncbi:SDR family oxidoreductase [Evansella sp. AB-rgal1]|uniref:SDR family oxidoreductase n=1 Tax=Evansella sp. AB-rgal1 TaxID=3242696 RepID=UPI00359E47B6